MTQSREHLGTDSDRERDAQMYEVVYLIKRPGYEFVFSVPATRSAGLGDALGLFQLRFQKPHQDREIVLDLKALEDFYESLSRLMDDVNTERQKLSQP
jgi:hypothetical protein